MEIASSNRSTRPGCFGASFLRQPVEVRRHQDGVCGRVDGHPGLCGLSHGTPRQFTQQLSGGPGLACRAVSAACRNRGFDLGVAHFQVIFQLVGSHDADDGDLILLHRR